MGAGFSLQWGISGIINLAYGAMVILGSYLSMVLSTPFISSPFLGIPLSGAALFVLGAAIYRASFSR
jgi:branched-chain amino acid transport system permease protein